MAIPQLTSCCFCFDLKTGTKIIGWLSLIVSLLCFPLTMFLIHAARSGEDFPITEEGIPALQFRAVVLVIASILSTVLLMGVYQNKTKLVGFWFVIYSTSFWIRVICFLLLSLMKENFQTEDLQMLLCLVVDFYVLLVVHSLLTEMKNTTDSDIVTYKV